MYLTAKLLLTGKNRIVTSDEEISYITDNYFTEISNHLNLKLDVIKKSQRLANVINAFRNFESIQKISLVHHNNFFSFFETLRKRKF